jgi:hypothetical protein
MNPTQCDVSAAGRGERMEGSVLVRAAHGRDGFRVELTRDEALVLFESLSVAIEAEAEPRMPTGDDLCMAILSRLVGLLEKNLTETVQQNYSEIVMDARERLAGEYGVGLADDEAEG